MKMVGLLMQLKSREPVGVVETGKVDVSEDNLASEVEDDDAFLVRDVCLALTIIEK